MNRRDRQRLAELKSLIHVPPVRNPCDIAGIATFHLDAVRAVALAGNVLQAMIDDGDGPEFCLRTPEEALAEFAAWRKRREESGWAAGDIR